MDEIDFINSRKGRSTPRKGKLLVKANLGEYYLNKLYNRLLALARDVFESYSIEVPSLGYLAMMLELDFTSHFTAKLDELQKIGRVHKSFSEKGWWIEVIPF